MNKKAAGPEAEGTYDVVVAGAGIGGIYALHRFREQGLKVLGLEGAAGVGGVWFHNRYPGARVDIDSADYCYHFSAEIYNEWKWSERYATQSELLRYLNFVADRLDIKPLVQFETWLTAANWHPDRAQWDIETSAGGATISTRFLVMATGNLSAARTPAFEGLDDFEGEWAQTAHWPEREVAIAGRRIAVIGTGSSGVQAIPKLADEAEHLYVLQRSPNFSVPARSEPIDHSNAQAEIDVAARRKELFDTIGASKVMLFGKPLAYYDEDARQQQLQQQWDRGGHGMAYLFADQGRDAATNQVVADFVRSRIRGIIDDADTAETLSPRDHPIGSRRLCLDTDYYETFNRSNVSLIDLTKDPIERITRTGIKLRDNALDVDLIVFALGFHAFTGAIDNVKISNAKGEHPTDKWSHGPKTLLGLMTAGFPNFFFLTGPGSPSVLANLFLMNEYHVDWVADCIAYLDRKGLKTIEPTEAAQEAWTAHVAEVAAPTLRLRTPNYMVHRHVDGSGVFIPYIGGFNRYVVQADDLAAREYDGFLTS
jgi:cation diffusion facilitator CzcD-associated flavoprotein CzcO